MLASKLDVLLNILFTSIYFLWYVDIQMILLENLLQWHKNTVFVARN